MIADPLTPSGDGNVDWLMQAIISQSPIGVAVIDYDGVYRSVNPSYCRLYGYAAHEFVGNRFTMVFPAEQRELVLRRHQQFLSQGGEFKGELEVVTRDGRPLSIVSDSVRVPGDDPRGLRLVYVVDVTEQRRMEAKLRASEETYRMLFETVPQGIVYHDLDGRITEANPAALRILGLSLEQLRDRNLRDPRWQMIREDGTPFVYPTHPFALALATRQAVRNVIMGITAPGQAVRWILVNAIPQFRGDVLEKVYSCFEDVTDRVRRDVELAREAATDFLTGIANRRRMMDRLELERTRLARHPEHHCSVLAVDLDHFKHINDRWGHAAGDAVLRHTTERMLAHVRSSDVVGRMGGEEFLVILPDTGLDSACTLAERLRGAVAASPTEFEGEALPLTISVGVSIIDVGDTGTMQVLGRADRALYEAKHSGRNRVCVAA